MAAILDTGSTPTIGVTFRLAPVPPALVGLPGDPNVITVRWIDPLGVTSTRIFGTTDPSGFNIVRTSAGIYTIDLPPALLPGVWYFRWIGRGQIDDEHEDFFVVKPGRIAA